MITHGKENRWAVCSRSGFVAVAVEIPEDAPTECHPGTVGILEVWESERKWPGKQGLRFFYPLTVGFETSRYLKTSFSYDLTIDDEGVASFEKEGRCYRFRIDTEDEVEEDAVV